MYILCFCVMFLCFNIFVFVLQKTEGTPIIVMELCNAGSLYEVIDSPENAYGLDEEQFKLVILHVCESG